ncbi:MAG: methyltransferase domain-containing protein [Planctomycetia bacterium]|nr:methyltransferase domain-containing protein [Planctomycetia bacterium]
MMKSSLIPAVLLLFLVADHDLAAQEQSVKPGINDSFRDPDVQEFAGRFEVESREVFARRKEIVAACRIQPGQTIADIGAGTGLFTRMFSDAVGKEGRVIAIDISQKFLDHIADASREAKQHNVETLLCTADSTELPPNSVDLTFICDTYHHFEFPSKTMASLHRALKPGGRLVVVDFQRIEGTSTEWILNHVRAGQDVVEAEIVHSGFEKVDEEKELLKENYLVVFEKPKAPATSQRRGGRGPGAAMRADQQVFHYLLEHHGDIRRTVKQLDNGVETLTESDNPEVAAKIQEHVASMHRRVKDGRGLRYWDDLFSAIFKDYEHIQMTVQNTDHGVQVTEMSEDTRVVRLIQAHAEVVSRFVAHGFDEAHKNHPVPQSDAAQNE